MNLNQLLSTASITMHGIKLNQPDWSHYSHSIAFTSVSFSGSVAVHNMLNAYHEALEFELPPLDNTFQWKCWIDTALGSPDDICNWNDVSVIVKEKYLVQPHSVVILVAWLSDSK